MLLRVGAVPRPRSWDGAPAIFSSTPSERAGLRHVQARGTSPATTQEGLEERSHRGTTRSGKSRLPFLFFSFHWAFCVNVCGRRLLDKVKPCKCCRVFGFIRVLLLCAFRVFLLCVICVVALRSSCAIEPACELFPLRSVSIPFY